MCASSGLSTNLFPIFVYTRRKVKQGLFVHDACDSNLRKCSEHCGAVLSLTLCFHPPPHSPPCPTHPNPQNVLKTLTLSSRCRVQSSLYRLHSSFSRVHGCGSHLECKGVFAPPLHTSDPTTTCLEASFLVFIFQPSASLETGLWG